MIDFIELFEDDVDVELYSVKYEKLDFDAETYEIDTHDRIELSKTDDVSVSFLVIREVFFKPRCVFNIEASCIFTLKLKDEYINNINLNNYDLKKEIENNIKQITGLDIGTLSLIIAQLTAAYGNNPFITIPLFNSK